MRIRPPPQHILIETVFVSTNHIGRFGKGTPKLILVSVSDFFFLIIKLRHEKCQNFQNDIAFCFMEN